MSDQPDMKQSDHSEHNMPDTENYELPAEFKAKVEADRVYNDNIADSRRRESNKRNIGYLKDRNQ